jgi:hypothetical protein
MLVWLRYIWLAITMVVGWDDRKKLKKEERELTPKKVIESIGLQKDYPFTLPKLVPVPWRKDTWMLTEDWSYNGVFIPRYFFCDLDSVPRIPFLYSFFKGYARTSAMTHDFLYSTGQVGRKEADQVFYDFMKLEGVNAIRAALVFYAVRAFGWWSYNTKTGVYESLMAPEVRDADYPEEVPV